MVALDRPNSITVELLGKSFITSDVTYERRLTDRLSAGAGLGISAISRVIFVYDGTTYSTIDISVPVSFYGVVTLAGDRHRLIAPLGGVLFTEFAMHRYRRYITGNFVPFIGLGYELRGERFAFRVPVYLAYLGEWYELLPSFMPWAGISFGVMF